MTFFGTLMVMAAAVVLDPQPAPPPQAAPPLVVAPFPPSNRFRLSLAYTRVLDENGDLGNDGFTTQAVGLHWTFPSSTYVRNHLELGEQWERAGATSARGFRIDLISFGYPIHLVEGEIQLELEPIITPVRGEIMFVNGGGKLLRMEGGVGLELSAASRGWFVAVQPLAIDFRYWVYTSTQSRTGFAQLFPLRVAVGHEF